MINDFLVDFYSEKAGEQIDQEKINLINETYGNDYNSLITDLYSKYDPQGLSNDKLNLIKQTYNLSIEEPANLPTEEEPVKEEKISIDTRLNLKPDAEGLYNIRINDKVERFATPFMAGEPSIIRTQVQEVGGKANKEQVENMVNVMDSLQKDVYSNLSKYGIVEQGTLGAETYNLTVEDNRKIKDTIYEDFKSKTGLDVDRGSFDYIYNALEQPNKLKVEQEYKLSRIRPESTTLNKDFENEFAIQADKGKSETQLKVEALKEKQGDITFQITDIDNKINQVNNNQEITSNQKEAQLDDLEDNKKRLLQENKNLDSEINVLATTTERGPGRFGEDFGISYQKTNKELTADFFNEQGRSEETVKRLSKLAEDTDNTAGIKAQNILNSNPGISQREAVKKLYEDELLYLQQFEADGRNKFVNLKFSQAQLTGGNPIGSGVLKKLRDNNILIDEQGNVEVSLNQLRNLGVDSRDFEGFFDSLPNMVSDKDLKAIKSYNEEIDEVSTIAKSYRNLWRNNVDVGAIEKPSSLGFFTESAAKATLGYVGFNEKEADDFISGGKGTARTRINNLDTAIKVANQTEEVRKSMGGKIDLTDKQKENIDVSLSEEVATGVGTFVPDLMILGATGGVMNGLGYAKLISKMSPMARFVTGALVEEAKMQLILDMKPGGGATFYTLGQATAGLTPFKKRLTWLDPIFQKVIKAGPVGAISAEGAQVSELAYESLIGDKNFNTEFEELYKDFDTVARRAIVNSMVFGATGFTHVKRGDFITTRRKYEVVGKLQAEVNDLMGLPKETATSIEASGGVVIPDALKPKKNFEDLTPKEQKKFMEYSKRIQTLNQQIQVETMYHKLDPNSKNFEKDFDQMVTQPMNKGIKAVVPEFEGVKVKFGRRSDPKTPMFKKNFKSAENTAQYDPNTKEMFFDLDSYTAGKPVHEFTHAAVNAYFDANPNAKRNFTKRMSDIFSDFDFGQYTGTELETRIKNRYGLDLSKVKDRNLTAEEYLAFMGEFLADPKLYYTDTNLASNLMNEFRLEIKDILIESGIEKFAPTPKTAKDMVQLMALLGKSTRMGSKLDVKIGTLARLDEIDILGTRLIEGNREAVTKETRASKEIIDENENIVNRLKEAKEKGDTQTETDAKNDLLINNQGLINEFVNTKFVPDLGITREDFRSGVQLHVLDKVNKTYDPLKNPEYGAYLRQVLFGGGGFGGGRLGSILKELGQQGDLFTKDISDPTIAKQVETKVATEETPVETQKRKAIVVSDRLKGLSDKTVAKVKSKLATKALKGEKELGPITDAERKEFLEKQTYKSLKDLASEETQLMFGIKPKPGNLTKSDVKNAQIFINKDPDLFISLLPNQHTTKRVKTNKKDSQGNFIFETRPDKATGVQNVLLEAFYNKGTRKDNLTPWTKKSNIKVSDFLNVMGITERGNSNLYRKDSNVSARIKALVEQTGRIITNQTVREIFPNLPSTVAEGKSPILASKRLTKGLEKAYDEIVKTGTLDKKQLLKSLTIPWEIEAIENLNVRRFKSAIELGFVKKENLKKLTELDLERDAKFYNDLTIENIANREGESMPIIIERYMGQEISSITDGKKLKASIPGTTYRSADKRATPENFKKSKIYYQDFIQRLIPEGYLFSQLPNSYQKMIMNTVGMGDHRGRTNGRKFTFKEYGVKEGDYIGLLEAVYNIKELSLKGKGPSIKSFASDINIPAPGSSKTKASKAEGAVDFRVEAAKAVLGRGKFNVDAVLDANKAALQNVYNSAKEVVKNAKNPIEALDYIIDLMLEQTNRSIGGIKGLAGVESITMEGMRGSNPELTKELHNEHLTELFSMTKDFGKMMERFIKGKQSEASVDLQLKRMVEDYNQGIISEARREIKDFDGSSIRSYIDNLIFLGKDATKQIPLRESTFAEAKNMAEVIRNNATKTLLDRIAKTPYKKLTLAGILAKQQQMNKAEYQKLKNENINESKEYDIYASKELNNSEILVNFENRDKAVELANKKNKPVKKIRVFDFDDTLAKSKSLVFYNKPNTSGKPTPNNKAIFMIGGPGSGKSNIGKGLQLGRDGWKVVNQDIFIEAEKAKQGLPEIEKDYTKEQRSTRAKIGAAGRKAAEAKLEKYTKAGNGMVIDGTGASYNATMKKVNKLKEQGYEVFMVHAKTSNEVALERNKARKERSLPDFIVEKTQKSVNENIEKYKKDLGEKFIEIDTETIEYGKPLPKDFVSEVKSKVHATERGRLNAEEFAKQGKTLIDKGFAMDFSDFNIVREGERGPMFDIAKKIEAARGTEDIFVLTARAPESQKAIYEFLKSEGLEIPLENITGLGNSTGEAKANWLVGKAAEGYNDFYFADDAVANVKAVKDAMSVLDVKSKVQQVLASKDLSTDFNKLLEKSTGVDYFKEYSAAKAKTVGASKGKFKFFIPYSAEDFTGLIYPTLSKGRVGDVQMAWYKENLFNPYSRAMDNLSRDRVQLMADFKELKKQLDVPKDLRKKNESGFTNEQAVRVYLFEKTGSDMTKSGLSKTDKAELLDIVNNDGKLKAFADQILTVTKGDGYAKPGDSWLAGTITTDLIDLLNTTKRGKYLEEWKQNVDQIYSKENLNKLEAIYGTKYREALENSLARMKSGKNRLLGGNRLSNQMLDYINGSNAAIMFFNMRSAVLQTISSINYVNWSFNNPLRAGKALANQPQFWKDVKTLLNSNYLMDRRNGLRLNINESEIADAASTSKNKFKAGIQYILQKGYLPTQFADSFAIASGGATFYRNRINDLTKKGVELKEAEKQALLEWRQISEESQQSANPSKISQQQASDAGRLILMFANTPMQYARMMKRAGQDLINGRGDAKTNISKIAYYGFVQNLLFNGLQNALFKMGFDDTDEVDEKGIYRTANGMLDGILRGTGIGGAAVSVGKNFLMDVYERSNRKRPEYVDAAWKLTQFSPPLGSKISKIKQAAYAFDNKKMREEIYSKGFSLDNPAMMSGAKTISATTNVPLDRLLQKYNNIDAALAEDTELWERIAMLGGWPEWQIKQEIQKEVLSGEEIKYKKYEAAKGSTDFKTLKKLNKAQQVKMLEDLGYGSQDIRSAKKEADRIQLIIEANEEQ